MNAGYRAATEGAAVLARPDRTRIRVSGRAPGRMLTGIVSGSMPPAFVRDDGSGTVACAAPPSLVLTPKGRIVAELRLFRLGDGEEGAFLLDLPRTAADGLAEHLTRFLPPRFARPEDVSSATAMITVVGPAAAATLAQVLGGGEGLGATLAGLREGEERILVATEADDIEAALRMVRAGEAVPPTFDVLGPAAEVEALGERLLEAGAGAGDEALRELLRIEKGRPAFGAEIDDRVLPPEAGLQDRAIDHRKGCYTGQEVVVRVRDRGRVNRHLRGLLLGDVSPPAPGTPLFGDDAERPVGEVRSATRSPRFEQTIALGYVRREVVPPARVRVGEPRGATAVVRPLTDSGWAPDDGPPGTP